jgi:hypothetical protein
MPFTKRRISLSDPEGIGFIPTVATKKDHECSFNPFPNLTPYYKRNDTDHTYLTLGCQCGTVKEVIVQDLTENA